MLGNLKLVSSDMHELILGDISFVRNDLTEESYSHVSK